MAARQRVRARNVQCGGSRDARVPGPAWAMCDAYEALANDGSLRLVQVQEQAPARTVPFNLHAPRASSGRTRTSRFWWRSRSTRRTIRAASKVQHKFYEIFRATSSVDRRQGRRRAEDGCPSGPRGAGVEEHAEDGADPDLAGALGHGAGSRRVAARADLPPRRRRRGPARQWRAHAICRTLLPRLFYFILDGRGWGRERRDTSARRRVVHVAPRQRSLRRAAAAPRCRAPAAPAGARTSSRPCACRTRAPPGPTPPGGRLAPRSSSLRRWIVSARAQEARDVGLGRLEAQVLNTSVRCIHLSLCGVASAQCRAMALGAAVNLSLMRRRPTTTRAPARRGGTR